MTLREKINHRKPGENCWRMCTGKHRPARIDEYMNMLVWNDVSRMYEPHVDSAFGQYLGKKNEHGKTYKKGGTIIWYFK